MQRTFFRFARGFAVLLTIVVSAASLFGPPALALWITPDWRMHGSYDGGAYRLQATSAPETATEATAGDPTGVGSILTTLRAWDGQSIDDEAMAARMAEPTFDYGLDDVRGLFAAFGFEGRWVEASPSAASTLRRPFVALLDEDGGRVVLVREVALEHVLVEDPRAGTLLYPRSSFAAVWTGLALAFENAPQPPEGRH